MRQLRLSPELERSLLAGVIWGAVSPETVRQEELSPQGRVVFQATSGLLSDGAQVPVPLPSILLYLTDVHGVKPDAARAYLEAIKAVLPSAAGAESVVRKLRERYALLAIANLAQVQLAKGEYDTTKLLDVVAATASSGLPQPLATVLQDGIPDPPRRLPLRSLPHFSERVGGGLVGLTVLSGEPAVGKSALIWQMELEVNQDIPVIHYDTDNGLPTLMQRTVQMLGDDLETLQAATSKLYLRDSVRTLDSDLVHIPPPALVVVDIFQDLPTQQEYERQGLAVWIKKFKAIARRGYNVLVVSEVSRAMYNTVSMGAAKGTGEIEYAADLTLQMMATNYGTEIHCVKNRHGEFKGLAATLRRRRGFIWEEVTINDLLQGVSFEASGS